MKAVAFGLAVLVALVVLRSLVKSDTLAVTIALLLVLIPHAIYVVHQPLAFVLTHFLIFYPATVLMRRAGLFAFMTFYFSYRMLVDLASSADVSSWAGQQGLAALLLLALVGAGGLYTSLGRRLTEQRATIPG
jgi:hypothetical protein